MKTFLKIGCWNVHSIKSSVINKAEDKQYIKEVQSIDIFCMQETKTVTQLSLTSLTGHFLLIDQKKINILNLAV